MTKCKWAFDANDDICCNCDGIKFDDGNGNMLAAVQCEVFEPELPEQYEEDEEIPFDEAPVETELLENAEATKSSDTATFDTKVTTITENPKKRTVGAFNARTEYSVKSIRYMVGVTQEINGVYHKFSAEEEWDLAPDTNVEEVRNQLWNKLKVMIDHNVEEVR